MSTIAAGQKTAVKVSGTPGDVVQVKVRGAGAAAYTLLSSFSNLTLNDSGAGSLVVSPSTNSSYIVGNAVGTAPARTLIVKAIQTLVVTLSGRSATFAGHIAPSVVGRTVLVYFYPNGGHVQSACTTKTVPGGNFRCSRSMPPGTYNFFAQTNADMYNAAGRSRLVTARVA